MLVLAGVSLNAIVGDNGILNQAKKAKIASDKASIIELLDTELASYNIDTITGNPGEVKSMMVSLLDKGVIDSVLKSDSSYGKVTNADADDIIMGVPKFEADNSYTIDYAVKKGDYSILISADRDGIYKSSFGEVTILAGGKVEGGTTLVTDKAFESGSVDTPAEDKGKFTIEDDATVMFTTEIGKNGEQLSIYVKSGTHAQIKVFKDMVLSNAGLQRSAIDIEPGGILDLWIAEGAEVTVDSGYGGYSVPATSTNFLANEGIIGGNGAFAGIHVPHYDSDTTRKFVQINEDGAIKRDKDGNAVFNTIQYEAGDATLNLSGGGTIKSYGGDAGDGGNGGWNNLDWGAGAGGGAGAGIGGNGGNGASGLTAHHGTKGEKGEDCGIINISNNLKVYAYGGSGGSGGGNTRPSGNHVQSGGGGGGYPAAGIGGGGAGGASGDTHVSGAGFSSAIPESTFESVGGVNGTYLNKAMSTVGGAYYASYASSDYISNNQGTLFPYRNCPEISNSYGYSGGIGGGCAIQSSLSKGSINNVDYANLMAETGEWPDGGIAGKGGKIKVSSNVSIHAYNGSYITTKDSSSMTNQERIDTQALIYAQAGYDVKAIRELQKVKIVNSRTISNLVNEWSQTDYNFTAQRTIKSPYDSTCGSLANTYVLGIGSGAGSSQVTSGNGTYTIDPKLN